MKYKYVFLLIVMLPLCAYGQAVRTTIASGIATNPLIWDCTCIPFINDSIIINHTVTLNVNYGFTDGAVVINSSGKLLGDSPSRAFAFSGNATFINHGEFDVARTAFAGGTALNTGTFSADSFYTDISTTQGWISNGDMNITTSYWNRGTFTLGSGAQLLVGDNFYNGDSISPGVNAVLVNDGAIRVNLDFANSDTIRGTGQVCIYGNSANLGVLTGTIDICDLSPGGSPVDFNFGTIGSGVQVCNNPCTVGIHDEEQIFLRSYPNPTTSMITFEGEESFDLKIYNLAGKQLYASSFSNIKHVLDWSSYPSGIYPYVVTQADAVTTGKFIKE